jgi:hypothetical protein
VWWGCWLGWENVIWAGLEIAYFWLVTGSGGAMQ